MAPTLTKPPTLLNATAIKDFVVLTRTNDDRGPRRLNNVGVLRNFYKENPTIVN